MRRLLCLVVAVLVAAPVLVAVPLAEPATAHGGACTVYAPKPRYVSGGDIKVFGSFSCPIAHQKISVIVRVEARSRVSGEWSHYMTDSRSRSGAKYVSLGFTVNQYCNISGYRTIVKGLAGSSGTVTHSRAATSPTLGISCA